MISLFQLLGGPFHHTVFGRAAVEGDGGSVLEVSGRRWCWKGKGLWGRRPSWRGWHIIGADKNVENKYKKSCLKSRAMKNCRRFNCCILFALGLITYGILKVRKCKWPPGSLERWERGVYWLIFTESVYETHKNQAIPLGWGGGGVVRFTWSWNKFECQLRNKYHRLLSMAVNINVARLSITVTIFCRYNVSFRIIMQQYIVIATMGLLVIWWIYWHLKPSIHYWVHCTRTLHPPLSIMYAYNVRYLDVIMTRVNGGWVRMNLAENLNTSPESN